MNILILSFYYPPDLSACSFRASALVKALVKQNSNVSITVLTTQPNRYNELSGHVSELETLGGVTIHRASLPAHRSGVCDQVRAYVSYARSARRIAKQGNWDVVVATSSRLMTAVLGAIVSRSVGAPLYLDIRDLFVDTIHDVFHPFLDFFLRPIFKRVEAFTFNSATRLNVVSEGFIPYVEQVAPGIKKSVLTNGVDKEFQFNYSDTEESLQRSGNRCVVLYAGNIGEGQGLHKIVPATAEQLGEKIQFRVIGSGGRIGQLRDQARALEKRTGVDNIEILPPVPRANLAKEYEAADILFVHLNDYEAFKKVLPSKIFEYAATGKPVIAGLAGYAATFVESESRRRDGVRTMRHLRVCRRIFSAAEIHSPR